MRKLLMIIPLVILLCFTFSCQQAEKGFTEEEAKAYIDRFLGIPNEGNLDLVEEFIASEYVWHNSAFSKDIVGIDAYKSVIKRNRIAFPDFHMDIDELIVKGNTMVARWTQTGTHTGPLGNISPSGRKFKIIGACILHLKDRKFVEQWTIFDTWRFVEQLGYTITPPKPEEKK